MSNIEPDCTVYCPMVIKILNSCPSRIITLNPSQMSNEDVFEIFMVLLSTSPYLLSFLILISTTYFRTARGSVILMMIFFQNMIIEVLKGSLRDPRPNFKCNQQFGNPSNHATFFSSLITWIVMEHLLLERRFRFQYNSLKFLLISAFPFILYSRVYLKYHTQEQVKFNLFFILDF